MEAAIQAELDKLTGIIVQAAPVEQIYLFGSYAYGKPQKDSDLDLYVVIKDDYPLRALDAGLQISLAIDQKKSMAVDIIAKKKKGFFEPPGRVYPGAGSEPGWSENLWIKNRG